MLKHFRNKLFSELFGEPIDPLKPKTPNPNPNYRPPIGGSNIPEQLSIPRMPKEKNTNCRPPIGGSNVQTPENSIIALPVGVSLQRTVGGWEIEFKKQKIKLFLPDLK